MSTPENNTRPRLGAGLIVLLVLLTAANVFKLFLAWGAWTDMARFGGGLVDYPTVYLLVTAAGLAGLGGAWFLRSWGPALYFVVVALETMIVLFVAPSALSLTTILPLGLAGLLWFVVANRVR